jgi:multicomponent K+:H+ antiporter subunit A
MKTNISLFLFFVSGPALFFSAVAIERTYTRVGRPTPWQSLYNALFNSFVPWIAKWNGDIMQAASLRRNIFITSVVTLGLLLAALYMHDFHPERFIVPEHVNLLGGTAFFLITASLAVVLLARDPVYRITAQAIVGVLIGLYFVIYRAPDVANTQILVELATLAILLLLLPKLKKVESCKPSSAGDVLARCVVSIGLGTVIGLLTYLAATSPLRYEPILPGNLIHRHFLLANAKYPAEPGAHSGGGDNVVNVTLVDFRGIDTAGEILVLAIAAIGVFCLMRVRRTRTSIRDIYCPEGGDRTGRDAASLDHSRESKGKLRKIGDREFPLLAPIAFPVTILMLAFSAVLLFAGHNAPGGGFIAGLLTATAFLPYYLTRHKSAGEPLGARDAFLIMALGIFFAFGTGLAALFFGRPFLSSGFFYMDLPIVTSFFGSTAFASAVLFDFGVYLVVVGSSLLIIRTFGRSN